MLTLDHLSGWQRLWLLLTVLYAIPVFAIAIIQMPTEPDVKRDWAREIVDAAREDIEKEGEPSAKKYIEGRSSYDIRRWVFKDASDDEVIRHAAKAATTGKRSFYSSRVTELENQYGEKLAKLWLDQAKILGIALLIWIGTAALVYALGAAIGWVVRGFFKKNDAV